MSKSSDPNRPFDDLYSILCRKELLIPAVGNIKNNKGSLTKGINNETIDDIGLKKIEILTEELKNKTFKFKAIRRVYIPKPIKTVKRPLGIPNFMDRIIQEGIRIILEAIYEPIFEKLNVNFGFRKNYSAHQAMHRIKKLSPACEIAIEGDIKGAYDNVNHDILIKILKNTISDKNFINLIQQGLKSGILEFGKYHDTLIGTPQGGIGSPILFNIYMHEFDKYIQEGLQEFINQYNTNENRKTKPFDPKHKRISDKIYRLRKKYNKLKTDEDGNTIKYVEQDISLKITKQKTLNEEY
jgi:group II intron reverse transcriptase/maturase